MSRKHNTKHQRARGRYLIRLGKRGLSKAPRMLDLDTLRRRAERRAAGAIEEEEAA